MATSSDPMPQQIEILQLVTVGLTDKTIDAEVLICEKTVEFHLAKTYTKRGVRTRLLVAFWQFSRAWRQKLGKFLV